MAWVLECDLPGSPPVLSLLHDCASRLAALSPSPWLQGGAGTLDVCSLPGPALACGRSGGASGCDGRQLGGGARAPRPPRSATRGERLALFHQPFARLVCRLLRSPTPSLAETASPAPLRLASQATAVGQPSSSPAASTPFGSCPPSMPDTPSPAGASSTHWGIGHYSASPASLSAAESPGAAGYGQPQPQHLPYQQAPQQQAGHQPSEVEPEIEEYLALLGLG